MPWSLAIIPSLIREAMFTPDGTGYLAGVWVYNDDHTDYDILGAPARVNPNLVTIDVVEQAIRRQVGDENRSMPARRASDDPITRAINAAQGTDRLHEEFEKTGRRHLGRESSSRR